ncbi:hypothetical protein EDD15DRAFT_2180378, partial [Pisolithus albus]
VSQLRSLELPPGALIGSVTGQPYADEAEMNLALRRQHDLSEFPPNVVESHSRSHPLVFTHGDIDPRNVMVLGEKVMALDNFQHLSQARVRFER